MKKFENLSTSQEKRPNEKFGRILFNLAFSLAIIGGFILILVILINVVSIISRIIFLNPLVGDFELVKIGSAIAIASFLPICHLKKGNVIVDFITAGIKQGEFFTGCFKFTYIRSSINFFYVENGVRRKRYV